MYAPTQDANCVCQNAFFTFARYVCTAREMLWSGLCLSVRHDGARDGQTDKIITFSFTLLCDTVSKQRDT